MMLRPEKDCLKNVGNSGMMFRIVAEGHEGVVSVPEECLAVVQATSEFDALEKFSIKEHNMKYVSDWGCYVLCERKIFARMMRNDDKDFTLLLN